MNYYFVQGAAVEAGVKAGLGLCDTLASLGIPVVVVTPGGTALKGVWGSAPLLSRTEAIGALVDGDTAIFATAEDYEALRDSRARLAFHCHAMAHDVESVMHDEEVALLSSWGRDTADIHEKTGRQAFNVGMSISDMFLYDGCRKMDRHAVIQHGQDGRAVGAAISKNLHLEFQDINGQAEPERARSLKMAGYCLVVGADPYAATVALEAMAAGCVTLTLPPGHATEFLEPGRNCIAAGPDTFAAALTDISSPEKTRRRAALRHAAIVTARRYRHTAHRRKLKALLDGPLGGYLSWR